MLKPWHGEIGSGHGHMCADRCHWWLPVCAAAGGNFREGIGKAIFRTRGVYQAVLQPDVVVNKVRQAAITSSSPPWAPHVAGIQIMPAVGAACRLPFRSWASLAAQWACAALWRTTAPGGTPPR